MIEVKLLEYTRKFNVALGWKKLGYIEICRSGGRVTAYVIDESVNGGFRYLDTHITMRQATNRILVFLGYGPTKTIRVVRALGGRAR